MGDSPDLTASSVVFTWANRSAWPALAFSAHAAFRSRNAFSTAYTSAWAA